MGEETLVGIKQPLQFPRDRYQGELPAVPGPDDPAAAIKGFADRIVSLTKLGVAPHHFRKAIAESPMAAELERAIGEALLRETTAPDLSARVNGREQGVRVSGGPLAIDTKASCAGAPVLVRSMQLEMHGNDDHVAKIEAFLEPPIGLVFHVTAIGGLFDVAMAWGCMPVPLMQKELKHREYRTNLPMYLLGRMVMNDGKAARVQLVRSQVLFIEGANVERIFAGALESPIASASVRIKAGELNEGSVSWSLLRAGMMKELGAPKCWELLRGEISRELLDLVAEPTGYKLKQLQPHQLPKG